MKIFLLSLGCAKNQVDTECLAGKLEHAGHEIVADVSDADAAVVNTCGFIRPAAEESISAILDLEELRKNGKLKKIGVVGCLLNRYGEKLIDGFPAVDFWAASEDWDAVVKFLGTSPVEGRYRTALPSLPKWTRYLKISEGCNNHCTYCAIPSIRGGLRSLSMDVIVQEAQRLTESGAKELCVVGQDLTAYGTDYGSKSKLLDLLDALESSLPKNIWLRLLYLHPNRVTRKLLERVAAGTQIIKYLDIPVQHGDAEILAAMNRGIDEKKLLKIFKTARSIDKSFALRTTCMVGFPGEQQRHFKNLIKFVDEVQFDRMGAFTYYPEEGTKAAAMDHQVTSATKKRRLAKLMSLQEGISLQRQQMFIGKVLDVLVERVSHEEAVSEGRSFREAPEVDGLVEVHSINKKLQEGDVIKVMIKEALPHDMIGIEVYE